MKKVPVIIFDIDAVLFDSERCHLYEKEIKQGDFSWFREIAEKAPTMRGPCALLTSLMGMPDTVRTEVVFLTARSEMFKDLTVMRIMDDILAPVGLDMLYKSYRPFPPLFMRKNGDLSKDWEYKEKMLTERILPEYDVVLAIDDNEDVIEMYTKYNIATAKIKI